jgi:hypothetical protein
MDVGAAQRVLWKDVCFVSEYEDEVDEYGSTTQRDVAGPDAIQCKLSFETLSAVDQTDTSAGIVQKAKLFVGIEVQINPGSRILVYHTGRFFDFKQSGQVGFFEYHQEIPLVPYKDDA